MADKRGVPLTNLAGFPAQVAEQLAGLWITTAEELVVAARGEGGPQGLADYLNAPVDQVTGWVDLALDALPPGVTFDVDRPADSFGMGAMDEPQDEEPSESSRMSFAPLPNKVDLHMRMPPVRNQGGRGTCVSFACTAVREYLLGETNSTNGNLSEQYLYWACKQHDGYPGSGTYISVGMDRLLAEGECDEPTWPYNSSPIAGNEGHHPPPADASTKAANYKISETRKLPAHSVNDLRQALADGLPVAFAVPVFTYWFTQPVYNSGDIRLPLASDHLEGGHAMVLVGYEDDATVPGGGFFNFRNSWGTGWASQNALASGYGRMPYAYIQQYASAAHIAKVNAPEPEPVEPKADDWWTRFMNWLRSMFGGK